MTNAPVQANAQPVARYFHGGNRGLKAGDNPVVLPADRSFTPTHTTMLLRKPIPATALIQPQQARTRGEIPKAPAAPPPQTSRDFVPWRFLDAGRLGHPRG